MSQIDFKQMITAEDKRFAAQTARATAIKAECRSRIFAAADQTSQMNLTAAASSGRLNAEQQEVWVLALQWIDDMRSACMSLIIDLAADYRAAESWPDLPQVVAELVAQY